MRIIFARRVLTNKTLFVKIIILIMLLLASTLGCKKNKKSGSPQDQQPDVVITNVSILKGPGLTSVTISGSGFSSNVGENRVTFNGVEATIESATASTLQVKVPLNAGTGKVEVKVGGKTGTGPVFEYEYVYMVGNFAGQNTAGFADGSSTEAKFAKDLGRIRIDKDGNIYVGDQGNNRIRKITPQGMVTTFLGSTQGNKDGDKSIASFNQPYEVAIGSNGVFYIADVANYCIRKVTADGTVSTFAGAGMPGYTDGQGTIAKFKVISGLTLDALGNLYVADPGNSCIRKITPAGLVSTFAGSGSIGYADGSGATAKFGFDFMSMVMDSNGNLYLSDGYNNCIRKITPDGTVSTYAGLKSAQVVTDGLLATARFFLPNHLAIDSKNNIYVGDNYRIRKISTDGIVSTVAGKGIEGGVDGKAEDATFNNINGIAISPDDKIIYVADVSITASRIRKIGLQ